MKTRILSTARLSFALASALAALLDRIVQDAGQYLLDWVLKETPFLNSSTPPA